MVRITEDLVRRKAEHNEGEISTLEELSLHQENIERIENLDKWCKNLKILYLQSNLIPKIENVNRLKQLEYLNLALNNIEKVENLQGCESLQKLDLTVNFVGELTSIECLKNLIFFRELYLTGNPCSLYEGYRDYVIATLPHLKTLDGTAIEKSERILATQNYGVIKARIIQQQIEYKKKREIEKIQAYEDENNKKQTNGLDQKKPGFDGTWYTDINEEDREMCAKKQVKELEKEFEEDKDFWSQPSAYTPEERIKAHRKTEEVKLRDKKKEELKNPPAPPRRLFADDGRPLNVNESKINFKLTEDDNGNNYILDYQCYKYIETSLIDVNVQPRYVRIVMKGKIFQLALDEDVNVDSSKCQRSQITGSLVVFMPKAKQIVKPSLKPVANTKEENKNVNRSPRSYIERLEVDETAKHTVDFSNIVKEKKDYVVPPLGSKLICKKVEDRPNSDSFVDDPSVPPLE